MNMIRSVRFILLGLTVGAGIQIPILWATQLRGCLIVQACIFVVAAPLTFLGFRKK